MQTQALQTGAEVWRGTAGAAGSLGDGQPLWMHQMQLRQVEVAEGSGEISQVQKQGAELGGLGVQGEAGEETEPGEATTPIVQLQGNIRDEGYVTRISYTTVHPERRTYLSPTLEGKGFKKCP